MKRSRQLFRLAEVFEEVGGLRVVHGHLRFLEHSREPQDCSILLLHPGPNFH
jgi:hypothetical protein